MLPLSAMKWVFIKRLGNLSDEMLGKSKCKTIKIRTAMDMEVLFTFVPREIRVHLTSFPQVSRQKVHLRYSQTSELFLTVTGKGIPQNI